MKNFHENFLKANQTRPGGSGKGKGGAWDEKRRAEIPGRGRDGRGIGVDWASSRFPALIGVDWV